MSRLSRCLTLLLAAQLLVAATATATATATPAAAGRAATAGTLDPRLVGYPEVVIRLTDEKIEAPATVTGGRVLLVQENAETILGHGFVMRLPDDVPEADLTAALAPGVPPLAVATPDWFWRATFVGNADRSAPSGGRAVGLVDLEPGRYLAGDPYRPPAEFARFEVTAPDPAVSTLDDPGEDVAATLVEMAIELPATIPAGPRVWEVVNKGAMIHEMAIVPVPAEATVEQVQEALTAALAAEMAGGVFEEQGAPAGFGAEWAGWRAGPIAGVGVASNGRPVWPQIDLAPGRYAAVCFIPLPQTGQRHFEMGMATLFTVEEATAEVASLPAPVAPAIAGPPAPRFG